MRVQVNLREAGEKGDVGCDACLKICLMREMLEKRQAREETSCSFIFSLAIRPNPCKQRQYRPSRRPDLSTRLGGNGIRSFTI